MQKQQSSKIFNQIERISITLYSISINISQKIILDHVNLDIREGEMIAVLGKSGAGKSTLLRVIAGLIKSPRNTVFFNGSDLLSLKKNDKNQLRKKIGFIPQQFKLIKELNVFENVMIGRLGKMGRFSSMFRIYPQNDKKIALECIAKVGLSGKESLVARKLSGGEQQRVAIARCLAQEPQIILADEPVASLDVSLIETILEILNNENKKGKTVVFVMHDVDLAKRFAKRMILMKEGKIISDKLTEETKDDSIKSLFN